MVNYKQRKEIAKDLIENSDEKGLDLYQMLYLSGVSLRIIEELTGVKRSKLQRYFAENGIKREDTNTQKKDYKCDLVRALFDDNLSIDEIASEVDCHPRTVERYLKELGYVEKTNFDW